MTADYCTARVFPTLISVAKTRANRIEEVTIAEDVIARIVSARKLAEARHALRA